MNHIHKIITTNVIWILENTIIAMISMIPTDITDLLIAFLNMNWNGDVIPALQFIVHLLLYFNVRRLLLPEPLWGALILHP